MDHNVGRLCDRGNRTSVDQEAGPLPTRKEALSVDQEQNLCEPGNSTSLDQEAGLL